MVVTRAAKSKTCWLHFLARFSTDQGEICYRAEEFKLNNLTLLFSDVYWNKGSNCCFTDCKENLSHWHAFGCLCTDLVQPWSDDTYYQTLHLDLDLDSRSQGCKKIETSAPFVSQSFKWIGMKFVMLLRLIDLMILILIVSHLNSIPGRIFNLGDLVCWKKNPQKQKHNH